MSKLIFAKLSHPLNNLLIDFIFAVLNPTILKEFKFSHPSNVLCIDVISAFLSDTNETEVNSYISLNILSKLTFSYNII